MNKTLIKRNDMGDLFRGTGRNIRNLFMIGHLVGLDKSKKYDEMDTFSVEKLT